METGIADRGFVTGEVPATGLEAASGRTFTVRVVMSL